MAALNLACRLSDDTPSKPALPAVDGKGTMGEGPCDIKISLLSQLSAVSEAHAHQTALLTAIAASGDHDEFTRAIDRCSGMQRMYDAAKHAFEAHRSEHGC